jgi:hypothetical protein
MSGHKIDATFYAAVVPEFGRVWRGGSMVDGVERLKVKRIWQSKPDRSTVTAGTVVVKLTLQFSEAAFMPMAPSAVITIPDSLVQAGMVVDVEAVDENDPAVLEYLARKARGEA